MYTQQKVFLFKCDDGDVFFMSFSIHSLKQTRNLDMNFYEMRRFVNNIYSKEILIGEKIVTKSSRLF